MTDLSSVRRQMAKPFPSGIAQPFAAAENLFLSACSSVTYAHSWHIGCSPSVREHGGVRGGDVAKEDRGFASMDRNKQREIASKGGKAAHQKGTAHEWTSEEAREAGRKGGMASHRRKQEQQGGGSEQASGGSNSEQMMGSGNQS
jgi:general stress protein YciG